MSLLKHGIQRVKKQGQRVSIVTIHTNILITIVNTAVVALVTDAG